MQRYFSLKKSLQFSDICMHVETRYFLNFQNILGIKNFQDRTNIFSDSPKYYFLENARYLQ